MTDPNTPEIPPNAAPPAGPGVTRRRVLSGAAAAGAAVAAAPLLGGTAHAAGTAPAAETAPAADKTAATEIKHIVFLMLENRSYDHLLGTLSVTRGFDDRSITRPDGGSIFAQYDPVGSTKAVPLYRAPFNLTNAHDAQGDADLSHNWGPQHLSLNGGRNDGWIGAHRAADGDAKGIFTMAYVTRAEVPYHYALADAFTICDNYFCSVLGPTYPNRMMWQQGSIDANAQGGGPLLTTDEGVFTGAAAGAGATATGMGVFNFPTYPEKLTTAGITWKAYTDAASNHLLNMFPAFTQYNNATALPGTADATNYQSGTVGSGSSGGFLADVQAGTLPQVSWIFPDAGSTEHPGDGPINAGPTYYHPVITALMASRLWANTVLIITYDENDGYFDHVSPPQAPAGTHGEFLKGPAFGASGASTDPTTSKTTYSTDPSNGIDGPVGLGFRVPTWVVSPWSIADTNGGFYNSEVFDHISGLKLIETVFKGVATSSISPKPIVSDWRYDMVGDLTSTMNFTRTIVPGPTTPSTALTAAFAASQAALTPMGTEAAPAATPAAMTPAAPKQESAAAYPRQPIGPKGYGASASNQPYTGVPAATSAPSAGDPAPALPEVGQPAMMLGVGMAAALSAVAYRRVKSGGKSDSTQAGGHLRPPVPVAIDTANDDLPA